MIFTPRQALDLVRRHGVVTMTHSEGIPSLVEEVAGGPVKGSWWGHPKGKLIYRLAESLHDSGEVLSLKLVGGKVTFLHRSRWPALARVVTDPAWRRSAQVGLSSPAAKLLRVVERLGTLRLDRASLAGRKELELSLLVHSGSVHTEKGSHSTILAMWSFDRTARAEAERLDLEEARKLLGLLDT
jgi:hypothetical protein